MNTVKEVKQVQWFDDRFYKITYSIDNKEVTDYFPSTTTKLGIISKPWLAKWRGDIGNREADLRSFEAAERGVRIHHAWYTMTTGGIVVYNPPQNPNYSDFEIRCLCEKYFGNVAIIKYQDEMYEVYKLATWLLEVKPQVIASELVTYSIKNRDAGTADNLFHITGGSYAVNGAKPLELPSGLYIVDLKTGNTVDDDAFLQTANYAFNVKEMGIGNPIGTLIIHTGAKTQKGITGLSTLYRNQEQMELDYQDFRLAAALWERKNADAKPKIFEFPTLLTYEVASDSKS